MSTMIYGNIVLIGIILLSNYSKFVFAEQKGDKSHSEDNNTGSKSYEEFKATNEWQSVKKGQPLPRGLHIRVNLQTGETEAKLATESDSKKTDVLTVSDDDKNNPDNFGDSADQARAIKDSLFKLEEKENSATEEFAEQVRRRFRSYKELKDTFHQLNMTVKTDLEIMNELMTKFKVLRSKKEKNSSEEQLLILTDLEYLVHQFDNAREFVRSGGVTDIVLPMLNSTSPDLRSEAAHLLGSAAQSNVRVQIAALASGTMAVLLKAVALDESSLVRVRAFYALSCLIRNFPVAQARFIKEGGLSVLGQIFEKGGQEERKLQVKAVTLLHDLILERHDAFKMLNENSSDEMKMKVQQYKTVGLEEKLKEHDWCSRIAQFLLTQDINWGRTKRREDLSSALTDLPVRPEHDVVEKVTGAMLAMVDVCHSEFNNNKDLKEMISDLKQWYSNLATKEDLHRHMRHAEREMNDDSSEDEQSLLYYSKLAEILENLSAKLNMYHEKDEL